MALLTEEEIELFYNNSLTQQERDAIAIALNAETPWKHDQFDKDTKEALSSVKTKIKEFHLGKVGNKCCYCRRSLLDASIESDREHIVPKGKVEILSYDLFNLSIACKRCNMTYKGEKLDHIVDFPNIRDKLKNSNNYKIPHPNLDNYEDHLTRLSCQIGAQEFTTYSMQTDKGRFLYDFVQLHNLCINEFDKAQGGNPASEILSNAFDIPIEGA